MKVKLLSRIVLLFAILSVNAQSLRNHPNLNLINEDSCGTTSMSDGGRSKRVVNGNDAKLLEMPWAALLGYESITDENLKWRCSGVLIHKKFVLTTAVCIHHGLKIVRLGEHKVSTELDCDDNNNCANPVQDIVIEETIKHENYDSKTHLNDIAMLKLATEADTTKNNVRTICLPIDEESYLENLTSAEKILTVFGWGRTLASVQSDVLQKAYVPYVDHDDCIEKYAPFANKIQISPTFLCAGGKNGTDTCLGDSGSGITAIATQKGQQKETLYGINSFGPSPCGSEIPSIYTNIHHYLDWILNNIS